MAYSSRRIYQLLLFFLVLASFLVLRLFYLQIISGPQLALEGLGIRVQELPVEVARGEITDRNHLPLTSTSQQYSVIVFPGQIDEKTGQAFAKLDSIIPISQTQLDNALRRLSTG